MSPTGFITRDPIGYVDGANFYAAYFVPLGRDPSGYCKCAKGKDEVGDDFGNSCCPEDMDEIRLRYSPTKLLSIFPPFIDEWGHCSIQTPNKTCGLYPKTRATESDPNKEGDVVDDSGYPFEDKGGKSFRACPSAIDDMDNWLDDMDCRMEAGENPFGGAPDECYMGMNGTEGRNCIGFACTGIEVIGGKPPRNPTASPLPVTPMK